MTRFTIFAGFDDTPDRGADNILTHADFVNDAVAEAKNAITNNYLDWAQVYDNEKQKVVLETNTDSVSFNKLFGEN